MTCPNCHVRLKVAEPGETAKAFTCPKCKHEIVVPGLRPAKSEIYRGLLLATIGALLAGGGIAAGLFITRPAPPPERTDNTQPFVSVKDDAETLAKEQAKKADLDRRQQDYLRWMIQGGTAANAQKWAEAQAAYQKALIAMPGDVAAKQRLQEVQYNLAALERAKLGDEKIQAGLKKLLEQGDEALANKQFAAALEIYKLVLRQNPGDASAARGVVAAQAGLDQDQAERKKLDDFRKHLAAGQAALRVGRYTDAIAEFIAARQLLPKSAQAAELQGEAERRLAADRNRKDQKVDFDRLVDLGSTALRDQRFADAADAYKRALFIFPDDAIAAKGLDEARLGLKNAAAQFDLLMARGNNAMRDARFKDAVDAFQEAARLFPANDGAAQALRAASAAFENQASYIAAMQRAALAMRALTYDDAVLAYAAALRLVPNDPLAAAGLADAQRAVADAVRRRADWDALVKAGTAAAKQRKYADAAKAFKDALRIQPNNPQADAVRSMFRYNDNMADGFTALNARRYQDAIRHFQAALAEVPNDASAMAALTRARNLSPKN
jgi:tetratricopeptide (TPR) repeat protein